MMSSSSSAAAVVSTPEKTVDATTQPFYTPEATPQKTPLKKRSKSTTKKQTTTSNTTNNNANNNNNNDDDVNESNAPLMAVTSTAVAAVVGATPRGELRRVRNELNSQAVAVAMLRGEVGKGKHVTSLLSIINCHVFATIHSSPFSLPSCLHLF
jgi:hypothetical protein